ncbi:MAG: hypothetical protein QOG29_1196, partial [Gaiellaceae bacterium]|nr:hypothetical protein [Gaiellaceae bacterium]
MARLAIVPELDTELEQLYGLPLEEFTGARNELAARLKKAGQGETGEQVRALRKPSVAVWTVNQLARRHPDAVDSLIGSGASLRAAQSEAFRGRGGDAVREATRAEREALRAVTRLAEQLLAAERRPVGAQTLERVNATLRAASVDPAAAELLRAGRLPDELESPG